MPCFLNLKSVMQRLKSFDKILSLIKENTLVEFKFHSQLNFSLVLFSEFKKKAIGLFFIPNSVGQ